MLARDILKLDVEIEEKYPVDVWEIDGIKVWPLIRISLNFQLQKIENKENIQVEYQSERRMFKAGKVLKRGTDLLNREARLIRSNIADWSHQDRMHKSDIFFMTDNMDRVFPMLDGTLYDRVLDPLKDAFIGLGYNIFSMEEINGEKVKLPRYSNSSFYQIQDDMIRVKKFINRRSSAVGDDDYLPEFEKFVAECSKYGVNIRISNLIRQVNYIIKAKEYFQHVLQKCGTKIVITRCWYVMRKMALCAAAKEMKIPIVDIQHGVAGGGEHHLYCQWTKMPENGYELIPNVFWCNTEADAEAIRNWQHTDIHTKVIVGGRSLQLFWDSDKGHQLTAYYMDCFRKKIEVPENSKVVLLSLQSLFKNTERYPEWLPDFISKNNEFFWLIRRHPMMDETQKEFLHKISGITNINVEEASRYPLDVLLELSDVHVTMFSTVAMEAAEHGVGTVFLTDSRDYSAVVPQKYIFHGLSYKMLKDCLNEAVRRKSGAVKDKRGMAAVRELEALMGRKE